MRQPSSCTPPPPRAPLHCRRIPHTPMQHTLTRPVCVYICIYIYISHVFFGNFWQFFFDFFSFFYRIFLKHFISCAFLFRAFFGVGDVHHTHTHTHTRKHTLQLCRLPPVSPFSLVVPRCSLLCVVKWNVKQEKGGREMGRQEAGRRTQDDPKCHFEFAFAFSIEVGRGERVKGQARGQHFQSVVADFLGLHFLSLLLLLLLGHLFAPLLPLPPLLPLLLHALPAAF